MGSVRGLLAIGNGKLGQSIHHFDLPARSTCPGLTSICERVCYATRGRFRIAKNQDRLQWCYEQSQQADFPQRLTREIRRKGAIVVRLHVSGDFYDAEYVDKWCHVVQTCPTTRFYFYTRSWRVESMVERLTNLAAEDNVRAWFSTDRETGIPSRFPITCGSPGFKTTLP